MDTTYNYNYFCRQVKKRQLRAQFLLDSCKIKYEVVDISDQTQEVSREKMLREGKRRNENNPPQPPQFFNEDEYCGVSFLFKIFIAFFKNFQFTGF